MTQKQNLSMHPVTALFPRMPEEEFRLLVEDIRERGVLQPILVHGGEIIDGRHRYEACQELGIPCPAHRLTDFFKPGARGEPAVLVDKSPLGVLRAAVALNVRRRHLDAAQRAAFAAELLPHFKEAAQVRQVEGGKRGRRAQAIGSVPAGTKRRVKPEHRAAADAAKAFHVSARSVARADRVRQLDLTTFEKVKRGKMSLRAAERAHVAMPAPPEPVLRYLHEAKMALGNASCVPPGGLLAEAVAQALVEVVQSAERVWAIHCVPIERAAR